MKRTISNHLVLPALFIAGLTMPSSLFASDAKGSSLPMSSRSHSQVLLETKDPGTIKASRLPRRDTKSALVCTAADAAPKLQNRTAEGSCRSHTEEHVAEKVRDANEEKFKKADPGIWNPTVDTNAMSFSGR